MIPLIPSKDIFGVVVPSEYTKFKISATNYLCGSKTVLFEKANWRPLPPRLGETGMEPFKIIGTVTHTGWLDFDAFPFVQEKPISTSLSMIHKCKDFEKKGKTYLSPADSFLSAIRAAGITLDENQKLVVIRKI